MSRRFKKNITSADLDGGNWESDLPVRDGFSIGITLFGDLDGGTFTLIDSDRDVLETITPPFQGGKVAVDLSMTAKLTGAGASTDLRLKAIAL